MKFAEILENKIKRELENCPYQEPISSEYDTHYSHLSYIMGVTNPTDSQKYIRTLAQKAYQPYRPKPRPRVAHALSEEQQTAYEALCQYSQLHPGFNRIELKKAHRVAVKATHPDLGGNPAVFAKTQAAYQILLKLL